MHGVVVYTKCIQIIFRARATTWPGSILTLNVPRMYLASDQCVLQMLLIPGKQPKLIFQSTIGLTVKGVGQLGVLRESKRAKALVVIDLFLEFSTNSPLFYTYLGLPTH